MRELVQDYNATFWSDEELLRGLDDVLGEIGDTIRQAGQDHELGYFSVPPASFVDTEMPNLVWMYRLPRYVQDIRLVHGMQGDRILTEFVEGPVESLQVPRSARTRPRFTMFGSRPGKLGLHGIPFGSASRFSSIRVFFTRRHPPMHYGTAGPGGSTTTIELTVAPTGKITRTAGMYVDVDLQLEDTGEVVRVTEFDGTLLTVDPALAAASAGRAYQMILPIEDEWATFAIVKAANLMALRTHNTEMQESMGSQVGYLESRFRSAMASRMGATPKRMYSSRTR